MTKLTPILAGIFLLSLPVAVPAHHSFVVHYVGEHIISVTGVVEEFRFRNPHGIIFVNGTSSDGNSGSWKIETNSPNILRRRGWTDKSISPGDEVIIEGYPARDGSNAMRIFRVRFADGSEMIGQRPSADNE